MFFLATCTWYGISPNVAFSPLTILGSSFKIPAAMWQIIVTVCKMEDIKKFYFFKKLKLKLYNK